MRLLDIRRLVVLQGGLGAGRTVTGGVPAEEEGEGAEGETAEAEAKPAKAKAAKGKEAKPAKKPKKG